MKRIIALLLAAMTCLCGCEKIFTPMSVTFSADGGTATVQTSIQPQTLDILNYDGEGVRGPEYDEETKVYTISNDWLTASISESSMTMASMRLSSLPRRTLRESRGLCM